MALIRAQSGNGGGGGFSQIYFGMEYRQNYSVTFPEAVDYVYVSMYGGTNLNPSMIHSDNKIGRGENVTFTDDDTNYTFTVTITLSADGTTATGSYSPNYNGYYIVYWGVIE